MMQKKGKSADRANSGAILKAEWKVWDLLHLIGAAVVEQFQEIVN